MSGDWWQELVRRWWPGDLHVEPDGLTEAWLRSKHDVAARIQPSSIGEFGVRAGYSAFAMLSGAPVYATYLGYDFDDPALGTEPGSLDHARNRVLAGFTAHITSVNTHDLTRVPPFGLLHIDGDHTVAGCTEDLELAAGSGVAWVLVDDYDTGDLVRRAVDEFAKRNGLAVEHIEDGFRGSALLDFRGFRENTHDGRTG